VLVTQNRDTEQSAWCIVIAEVSSDNAPGCEQVLPALAGDIHRRLDHVGQVRLGSLQDDPQIGHDTLGLSGHIADGDDDAVLIQGTSASGEDQP